MSGKTHLAVGIATTFAIMKPKNVLDFAIGLGICALGSLLPDIDSGASKSHRSANKITGVFLILIALMWYLEFRFKIQIENYLLSNEILMMKSVGILLFVGLCAYGRDLPHRTFTHSFLGILMFCGVMSLIAPMRYLPHFAIGYLTHILLDVTNTRKINLFFPLNKGAVCLGWFRSDGLMNGILFICACGLGGIEIYRLFVRM